MFKEIVQLFKSDSLYDQALNECYEMLDLCKEMFNESIKSLRKNNTDKYPLNIYAKDKKINEFERDVRRKVMTHLGVSNQQDISAGLALVSIVIDIERIGDYTKNIYDLAIQYPKKLSCGSFEQEVSKMEDLAKKYLNDSIEAFKNQDINLARRLMEDYKKDISSAESLIIKQVISGNVTDLSASQASSLCLYLRYLKRISAHSRNLVSSIVNPFDRIGYPE